MTASAPATRAILYSNTDCEYTPPPPSPHPPGSPALSAARLVPTFIAGYPRRNIAWRSNSMLAPLLAEHACFCGPQRQSAVARTRAKIAASQSHALNGPAAHLRLDVTRPSDPLKPQRLYHLLPQPHLAADKPSFDHRHAWLEHAHGFVVENLMALQAKVTAGPVSGLARAAFFFGCDELLERSCPAVWTSAARCRVLDIHDASCECLPGIPIIACLKRRERA